jgi:hypothetical protein
VTTPGPEAILATLVQHGIDFVVIGGLAAIAHGSRRMTRDIDVIAEPADDNLARLAAALGGLGAVQLLANADERPIEAAEIAMVALGTKLHTRSPAGRLDIVGAPAGAAPYAQLRERSIAANVAGVEANRRPRRPDRDEASVRATPGP